MVNWAALGPRVTITREDGTSRVLPLERLDGGDYLDIAQSPDEGFPPPLAIGPPEQRSDVRTRQQILRDWRRGMGEDEYDETTGTNSFRWSRCDTRYKNVLVCRPLPVRLGGTDAVTGIINTTNSHARLAYVGSTARWFAYCIGGTAKYYNEATDVWTATSLTNGTIFFHQGDGGLYYIHNGGGSISHSIDGATWTAIDTTEITAAHGQTYLLGVTTHDAKVFVLALDFVGATTMTTFTLWQSTDAMSAPATASWTQLGTFKAGQGESATQLYVWKFPPQPERGGIFCLTNRRILWYDDTADAASVTAWKDWHKWDIPYSPITWAFALTWASTGDKYVMPSNYQDNLWQFTGSSVTQHGPNKRGGMPPSRQGIISWAAANSHSIVAWIQPGATIGVGNKGLVAAFNEQEGWNHLYDDTSETFTVIGGGLGPTTVATVFSNGTVFEQEFPDARALPQYATTARSYDTPALIHDTAKMDIGSPTIYKALLYHEMNAKIPTGATVGVAYRLDDSDQSGEFLPLDVATSATAMPWRVGFPANTKARQIELRYVLTRGTAASATPIIYSGILHTTLLPPPRFNTVFRIDLRDETYRALAKTVRGYSLRALRTFIRECHGQLLTFTIHHPGDNITVARGQAAVTPIESPLNTLGRYTVQVRDLTTPQSGV